MHKVSFWIINTQQTPTRVFSYRLSFTGCSVLGASSMTLLNLPPLVGLAICPLFSLCPTIRAPRSTASKRSFASPSSEIPFGVDSGYQSQGGSHGKGARPNHHDLLLLAPAGHYRLSCS